MAWCLTRMGTTLPTFTNLKLIEVFLSSLDYSVLHYNFSLNILGTFQNFELLLLILFIVLFVLLQKFSFVFKIINLERAFKWYV